MKKMLMILVFTLVCLSFVGCRDECKNEKLETDGNSKIEENSQTKEIVDMAGRKVNIPCDVDKIYSSGQPGAIMLYTTAPEKLLGWCLSLTDSEAEYIEPKYIGLPVLGLMQGSNDTANREEILKRKPDVIFTVNTINETTIQETEELQELLGIPIVMGDIQLDKLPKCYELVGQITGEIERAEVLKDYCKETIEEAKKIRTLIPEAKRKKVYYAQGSNGLQSASKGTTHSEVIDLVGGENVIDTDGTLTGRVNVNMEQILSYDPEVIIVSYSTGHTDMLGEEIFQLMAKGQEAWENVKAVKDQEVFVTPCLPYNWLDIPPSANRIIGIYWLGNLLYPEHYKIDLESKTKEFYKLFYRIELTDTQLSEILSGARK